MRTLRALMCFLRMKKAPCHRSYSDMESLIIFFKFRTTKKACFIACMAMTLNKYKIL